MNKLLASISFVAACFPGGMLADTFTIERDDPRPFRVHCGQDETAAVV